MASRWPDRPSASTHGTSVRTQLDYVVWMTEQAEALGWHTPQDTQVWRSRIERAYLGLSDSMTLEHGDPLPPDIPPALSPGTWPDVPASTIPGMTVRHQLTVMRTIATNCRGHAGLHLLPPDSDRWTARVQTAYDALDHGPGRPLPPTSRTYAPGHAPPKGDGKALPHPKPARAGKAKAAKRSPPKVKKAARAKPAHAKPASSKKRPAPRKKAASKRR